MEFQNWLQQQKKPELQPWTPIECGLNMSPQDHRIAMWLNNNLFKEREPRKKQLMLHGRTRVGKTYLVQNLARYCNIYYIPIEDWYCNWEDGKYDLAVFDEFRGQKTITWMNQWAEGAPMNIKKKMVAAGCMKMQNIPTIILANDPFETIYSNVQTSSPNLIEALNDRFEVVECVEQINLFQ